MSGPIDIAAEAIEQRHNDLSACPYYQTMNNPDVPTETCGFGCYDEPQCVTCDPGPWPSEAIKARYAALFADVDDPGLGEPSEDDYLDAISVLEALYAAGVRFQVPEFHASCPVDSTAHTHLTDWKPEGGA